MKLLSGEIDKVKPFLDAYGGAFSDLTAGARFMWGDEANAEYEIINDTLILRETYDGKRYFYYPLGKNVDDGFAFAEKQAKADGDALRFCALTEEQLGEVSRRYPFSVSGFLRDWSDYIYPAESFLNYAGKKLSGQRNHVNRFEKSYPDYKVHIFKAEDLPEIREFLRGFENEYPPEGFAKKEENKAHELLEHFGTLSQFGLYVTVGGKIVSFSMGEKVKDTLFVHIEKALKEYAGAYPKTAQEFARAFVTPEIRFINREEDCGDEGLRTSKTQYRPCEIKSKFYLETDTPFDKIVAPVSIDTERLSICEITAADGDRYCKLYTDDENNKYWGYDYREDLKNGSPSPEYFVSFAKSLKDKKEEYSLAVKKDGVMIGEIVLWNFDLHGGVETGFRFFKESQGKGYATESLNAVLRYLFDEVKVLFVKSRCNKNNLPSFRLLTRCGYEKTGEDEKYFYFEKKNRP